jgi:NitT/TauT family transport system substrate-binding protein
MVRDLTAALALGAALALAGAATAAEKVSIAALRFVSSAPIFIAVEKGYFAAEGLEPEIKFFDAAQPVAVAVASGDADFGVTGLTGGFYNLAGKGALKIVAAQSREEPGFDFVAHLASNAAHGKGLTSTGKLPGHSFGLTQVGSTFHYTLGRLAEKKGFPLDKVEIKPLQSIPNVVAALKSGQVDAASLPAHIAKGMEAKGEAKIIGWVHEETPWQLGALFTSSRNVAERRPLVENFVRAYQKATADYNAAFNRVEGGKRTFGPAADELIAIIQKYVPNQTPDSVKASAPFIDAAGRLDVGDIYEQVAWYKKQGLVDAGVDAKAFIDVSFVKGHANLPKS